MSKKILETLFDSRLRAKMLRFLFRNSPPFFSAREIAYRIQEPHNLVVKELKRLVGISLVVKNANKK